MNNYFKWVVFFFLLTIESFIKFIFSLFYLNPPIDLSSWVVMMSEVRKIDKVNTNRKNKVASSEVDYRNHVSEAYDGIQE